MVVTVTTAHHNPWPKLWMLPPGAERSATMANPAEAKMIMATVNRTKCSPLCDSSSLARPTPRARISPTRARRANLANRATRRGRKKGTATMSRSRMCVWKKCERLGDKYSLIKYSRTNSAHTVAIQPGRLGVRELGPGLAVAAGWAWFLFFCEPARRVVLVTDRRL